MQVLYDMYSQAGPFYWSDDAQIQLLRFININDLSVQIYTHVRFFSAYKRIESIQKNGGYNHHHIIVASNVYAFNNNINDNIRLIFVQVA